MFLAAGVESGTRFACSATAGAGASSALGAVVGAGLGGAVGSADGLARRVPLPSVRVSTLPRHRCSNAPDAVGGRSITTRTLSVCRPKRKPETREFVAGASSAFRAVLARGRSMTMRCGSGTAKTVASVSQPFGKVSSTELDGASRTATRTSARAPCRTCGAAPAGEATKRKAPRSQAEGRRTGGIISGIFSGSRWVRQGSS